MVEDFELEDAEELAKGVLLVVYGSHVAAPSSQMGTVAVPTIPATKVEITKAECSQTVSVVIQLEATRDTDVHLIGGIVGRTDVVLVVGKFVMVADVGRLNGFVGAAEAIEHVPID